MRANDITQAVCRYCGRVAPANALDKTGACAHAYPCIRANDRLTERDVMSRRLA